MIPLDWEKVCSKNWLLKVMLRLMKLVATWSLISLNSVSFFGHTHVDNDFHKGFLKVPSLWIQVQYRKQAGVQRANFREVHNLHGLLQHSINYGWRSHDARATPWMMQRIKFTWGATCLDSAWKPFLCPIKDATASLQITTQCNQEIFFEVISLFTVLNICLWAVERTWNYHECFLQSSMWQTQVK
jgi:hypothetical protein